MSSVFEAAGAQVKSTAYLPSLEGIVGVALFGRSKCQTNRLINQH